jgi:antitoxin MazE
MEPIVEVAVRKMGNSHVVVIPEQMLAQLGLEGTADLRVRGGVIEIRAIRRNPREGWADDARRLAEQVDEELVW